MMTRTRALTALTLLTATLTACSGDGDTPDAAPPSPSATTSPSPSPPPSTPSPSPTPSPTTEEPTPLPTGDPLTLVYEVKGTAGAAWISYTGTDGERRLSNVTLPWRTEIDNMAAFGSKVPDLGATVMKYGPKGGSSLTCRITFGDKVIAEDSAKMIVTCPTFNPVN